jgi:hypothetical protein
MRDMLFSVSYDPNGATGSTVPIDPIQCQIGVQAPVEANTGNQVKNGGTFANWHTAADGTSFGCGGPATVTNVGDVALYAQWFTTAGLTKDPQGMRTRPHITSSHMTAHCRTPARSLPVLNPIERTPSSPPLEVTSQSRGTGSAVFRSARE